MGIRVRQYRVLESLIGMAEKNDVAYNITWDSHEGGYTAFNGPVKIAVLGTNHHQGLYRNGVAVYEPIPREQWGLHFTSPSLPVAMIEAILASLPAEAIPKKV